MSHIFPASPVCPSPSLASISPTSQTIASVAGGSMGVTVVITLGFANLIADGISMGVGDGLSSQAEADFLTSERKREEWEYDNVRGASASEWNARAARRLDWCLRGYSRDIMMHSLLSLTHDRPLAVPRGREGRDGGDPQGQGL